MWKANVTYFHQRSSTINLASESEKQWMEKRADKIVKCSKLCTAANREQKST
jgi:hypothetical protein